MSSHKTYHLTDPKRLFSFIGFVIVAIVLLIVMFHSCGGSDTDSQTKQESKTETSTQEESGIPTSDSKTESSASSDSKAESSVSSESKAESSASDSKTESSSEQIPVIQEDSTTDTLEGVSDVEKQIVAWSTAVLCMTAGIEDENVNAVEKVYKIVIDPGCGGSDTGNPGLEDASEKDINLQVGMKLQKVLHEIFPEIEVIMTRTTDELMTDEERIAVINESEADLVISLHCDYFAGTEERRGIMTYYSLEETEDQARKKIVNLAMTAAAAIQKQVAAYCDTDDLGTDGGKYAILSGSNVPAVLVQMGYLSDASDYSKLTDEMYQSDLADGLSEGIYQALTRLYPNRNEEAAKE